MLFNKLAMVMYDKDEVAVAHCLVVIVHLRRKATVYLVNYIQYVIYPHSTTTIRRWHGMFCE